MKNSLYDNHPLYGEIIFNYSNRSFIFSSKTNRTISFRLKWNGIP